MGMVTREREWVKKELIFQGKGRGEGHEKVSLRVMGMAV